MKIYNNTKLDNWQIIKKRLSAFTIAEVIISTLISAMVLSFILIFMFDITASMRESKKEISSMESLYEIMIELNSMRDHYSSWFVIGGAINWSDILYMRNLEWTDWMLLWPVRTYNNIIDTNTNSYNGRAIWFKRLFSNDIIDIETNDLIVLTYKFLPDKIYYDLDLQSMTIDSYNSWDIIDLTLVFDLDYNQDLIWTSRSSLPKDSLRTFNINF